MHLLFNVKGAYALFTFLEITPIRYLLRIKHELGMPSTRDRSHEPKVVFQIANVGIFS